MATAGVKQKVDGGRGAEVRAWLVENRVPTVKGFVVLDDEHAESFKAHLPDGHLVQTFLSESYTFDPLKEGLTQEKAEEAFQCLMNPFDCGTLNLGNMIEAIEEGDEELS